MFCKQIANEMTYKKRGIKAAGVHFRKQMTDSVAPLPRCNLYVFCEVRTYYLALIRVYRVANKTFTQILAEVSQYYCDFHLP